MVVSTFLLILNATDIHSTGIIHSYITRAMITIVYTTSSPSPSSIHGIRIVLIIHMLILSARPVKIRWYERYIMPFYSVIKFIHGWNTPVIPEIMAINRSLGKCSWSIIFWIPSEWSVWTRSLYDWIKETRESINDTQDYCYACNDKARRFYESGYFCFHICEWLWKIKINEGLFYFWRDFGICIL